VGERKTVGAIPFKKPEEDRRGNSLLGKKHKERNVLRGRSGRACLGGGGQAPKTPTIQARVRKTKGNDGNFKPEHR